PDLENGPVDGLAIGVAELLQHPDSGTLGGPDGEERRGRPALPPPFQGDCGIEHPAVAPAYGGELRPGGEGQEPRPICRREDRVIATRRPPPSRRARSSPSAHTARAGARTGRSSGALRA